MTETFWEEEDKRRRFATLLARYMSWKLGEEVSPPPMRPGDHWFHKPLVYTKNGEPI